MILVVILAHFLLSFIFPIGRMVVRTADPILFTGIRLTLAGVLLLLYQWKKAGLRRFEKAQIPPLILFTVFAIYLTNVPEFWSLKFLPAAKASFLYSISPFVGALLSYICFNERITIKKMLGMLIGFIGFLAMISYEAPGETMYCPIGIVSWGEIAMIVAAVSTAYGWIIARPLMRSKSCSPIELVGIGMFLGGVAVLIQSAFMGLFSPIAIYDYYTFYWGLAVAVICSSVLGYVLYVYLLRFYSSTFISLVGFVEPFFAALISWFINGEPVTWRFFGCSSLVLIGVYIFYKEELKQGYIIKPL